MRIYPKIVSLRFEYKIAHPNLINQEKWEKVEDELKYCGQKPVSKELYFSTFRPPIIHHIYWFPFCLNRRSSIRIENNKFTYRLSYPIFWGAIFLCPVLALIPDVHLDHFIASFVLIVTFQVFIFYHQYLIFKKLIKTITR